MGGTISVKSKLGSGSTFTLTLPFSPVHHNDVRKESVVSVSSTSVASAPESGSSTPQMRDMPDTSLSSSLVVTGTVEIFSVDDEPTNQVVVAALLKARKYKVTKAMNGLEALEILQKRKEEGTHLPDVILLDVMMPKLNGFKTCVKIREMFPLSAIPIIMVSAKSREENVIQGLNCGANDYVTKPFKKLELLARIDTQMKLATAWQNELEREKSDLLLKKMLPHRASYAYLIFSSTSYQLTVILCPLSPNALRYCAKAERTWLQRPHCTPSRDGHYSLL